ncbi:MAG TPA: GH116 family glycosyl hydrolase [Acidimicrobiales bacterium]|nr:GH116 family glycosyl hydrolase [Acidimicrobiales bacterium]
MRISRRRLLAAAPLAVAAAALQGCAAAGDDDADDHPVGLRGGTDLWDIPDAAWRRALGSHPPGATGTASPLGTKARPLSRTKRGIPVGGIGTGAFMLNLAGSFGPWHLDIGGDDSAGSRWGSPANSGFEDRYLSQAAFHIYTSTGAGTSVSALATEDLLPAWPLLDPGSGVYAALFPKAWFVYEQLPLPVALKQLTPFVARDERRSSLPGGLFQLAVSNPTNAPVDVACMLSFPNAPYRLPTAQYDYTRQGLRSSMVKAPGTVGVRLQAEDPQNVAATQRTEWVIAARGPSGSLVTATEDWAGDGDGTDLLAAFRSGRLPDQPLDPRRLGLAGAVCVTFSLAPGEKQAATFTLVWDFPMVQFRNPVDGTIWRKRYTQWYPGGYQGWAMARDMLDDAPRLERGIDAWWSVVANDPTYPLWLRGAALNELYYGVFGGVFWENGCVTKPKRFGTRRGQHLYFTLETDVFRDCESMDVRHYEARHLLELFPTIERDVLLGWADMVNADPLGRTPHDAGSPVDDPWFVSSQYSGTRPGEPPVRVDWLDLPSKFVQQAHAYWTYTGDDTFGAEVYPALRRTMTHLRSLDLDGDGIPDAAGFCTTYDAIEMVGAASYVAALFIGACEAMADFALVFDTAEVQGRWSDAAAAARATAESALWSESGGYYQLDTGGPYSVALLADALCGLRYSARDRLPDVLDSQRVASHLDKAYRLNVLGVADAQMGASNMVDPAGHPVATPQARAVWPGGTYFTASLMHAVGQASGRPDLVAAALTTGYGVYRTTYEDDRTAFWFDTPALWLPEFPTPYRAAAYQRCRAVWELLSAIKDPFPPGWTPAV